MFTVALLTTGCEKKGSLTPQAYNSKYMPLIVDLQTNPSNSRTFILSDNSKWKTINLPQKNSPKWAIGDPVLVRWDHDVKAYFFHDIKQDPLLKNKKEAAEFVSMIEAPDLLAEFVNENRLTLSDGVSFNYVPVIDNLKAGDHVLVSLNEGVEGQVYPYFLIGFTKSNGEIWEITGEVQAREIKK
jgi:hypothetical protein